MHDIKSPSASSGKGERKVESLVQRWDALLFGVVFSAVVIYFANTTVAKDFLHAKVPLIHDYPVSLPVVSCVLYLIMVHVVGPKYAAHVAAHPHSPAVDATLRFVLKAWNLFLALLSIVMLLGLGVPLVQYSLTHSWETTLCDEKRERWNGPMMFWIYVFALSKYAELFDTVLLIVRNRPVNFLHWYHHTTVLLYTWFACIYQFSPGWAFATVNCFVHTIMYWYYYRSACGLKLTYDKIITQIQITQMVLGIVFTGLWAYQHYLHPATCTSGHPTAMLVASVVMYGSYFMLFASFYINRYLKANSAKGGAKLE